MRCTFPDLPFLFEFDSWADLDLNFCGSALIRPSCVIHEPGERPPLLAQKATGTHVCPPPAEPTGPRDDLPFEDGVRKEQTRAWPIDKHQMARAVMEAETTCDTKFARSCVRQNTFRERLKIPFTLTSSLWGTRIDGEKIDNTHDNVNPKNLSLLALRPSEYPQVTHVRRLSTVAPTALVEEGSRQATWGGCSGTHSSLLPEERYRCPRRAVHL